MSDNNIKSQTLPWTGERYLPEVHGSIELEHLHRYLFAKQLSLGKRVLDIASGEGYGSALLAQSAASVVGVDIAAEAIAHATTKYQADNLKYRLGSCAAIPLSDHSVDVVVSFETIEHHYEHDAMMLEIKRVLIPGGLLIISNPDKLEYSDRPNYKNLYHVKELYRDEFKSLLGTYFKHHYIAGQRVIYGSAIFGEDGCSKIRSYDLSDKLLHAVPGVPHAVYLVAIASDDELPLTESGILELPISKSDAVRESASQIANLNQVVAERDGQITNLNQVVADCDGQIANLNQVVADCDGQIANLNQAVAERDVQIASLKQSVADCESRITISQQSLLERKFRIDNLNQALIEAHRFVELTHSLEEKLRCSELKITEIFASTSWKASEPLRALSRLFTKLKITSIVTLEVGGTAQQIAERELSLVTSGFDAEFYRKSYPDICGCDLFAHYSEYGKNEGRLPCAPDLITNYNLKNLDRSKETVLIVSHEASRTGAPILALNIAQHLKEKYNVIAFLLGGGGLLADFQECCDIVVEPFPQAHNPFITSVVLTKLISQVDLKFAIVNSIVSKPVLLPLASHFVPSLCLVHEFASYTYPKNTIREVLLWASQVVFSARIVYENNAAQCVELKDSCPVILPQGKCQVPYSKDKERLDENQSQRIRKMFRPDTLPDNTVVILGAGFVQIRKGVDLFLACAARVVGLHPKNTFRFVWVGHGFDPDLDTGYSVYLQDQISRSGLEDHVCFTGEMSDIDMAYELSDVLFLSSRLDPLPNVAIDAMFKQLPVICFDNTTGIADLLKENGLGEACVVPYLNIEQAAQRLVALIENSDQRNRLGKEIKEVGEKLFDMRSYVASLERQVLDCVVMQETEKSDCALIENDGALNLDFYLPPSWPALSTQEAVRAFVRSWKTRIDRRKPFPGFHPGIYEDCHGLSQTGRNPLAAFIQAGKPEGPWLCDLIQPSSPVLMRNILPFRVALHIHVFFVDLFLDILRRLEGQEFQLDLLISVSSLEVAEEVSSMVSGYTNGIVDIRTVPNRGRDIGPLLTEFSETILKKYDVIGHVHTKKSGDVKDAAMGQIWLNFLLENLIGKRYPMALTILEKMAGDKQLGLVFPDDPWVVGWSGNKKIAEDLAHRCGIKELPDHHFNFPVGTMFWARTEALKPLLTKGFRWEDFPEEPLSYDGTVLHALERLLPFVAKKTGYHVAMTHVPGITR